MCLYKAEELHERFNRWMFAFSLYTYIHIHICVSRYKKEWLHDRERSLLVDDCFLSPYQQAKQPWGCWKDSALYKSPLFPSCHVMIESEKETNHTAGRRKEKETRPTHNWTVHTPATNTTSNHPPKTPTNVHTNVLICVNLYVRIGIYVWICMCI